MKCPACQIELPDEAKFCNICGQKLEIDCPECNKPNPPGSRFCLACGLKLARKSETAWKTSVSESERKQVTALFSDLTGYTLMTERLDPEEVKEITARIFGEVQQVVKKYDGFIEKFAGDGVLALFGVPRAHEDDPVRAVRAAMEIHGAVDELSPAYETKVGRPLSMHSGVNSGLVVTGEVDPEKGTHGVAGLAVNVAARLSDLASAGEIFIGPETYLQAEGHFAFEKLEPTTVKGKSEPISIYKVLSLKEEPTKVHRQSGLLADLIGRKAELAQLQEAVQRLKEGNFSIVSICGDAGTGKSRLVEEFKKSLDTNEVRWREGHSYPYSQNIPYFPLMDLMNRAWRIEEGEPPDKVREKIESGVERLLGRKDDVAPYVGSLYALRYPEIEDVSPEFWRSRLFEGMQEIVGALTKYAPTIFCFEDIHWADPSTLDLIRFLVHGLKSPALFICVYRLPFNLFSAHQLKALEKRYEEIRLQDLTPSDTLDMVESLLSARVIPGELRKFIQKKVEGNPFYVEEAINSLVESGTLVRDNGTWKLSRPLTQADVPPTIQGVISARLDRLEKKMKRILQEASVIGRAFLHDILKRITALQDSVDQSLRGLEMLDLVRVRSLQPDLEYIFKHALTQEVVYSGLLKKEREELHERIAIVMEQLFQDRISEFYETLAFHFKHGRSGLKAVDYLMKSAEKSLRRYALEESHQYYKDAFELLAEKPDKTRDEKATLIDLLVAWALVFYYQGDFGGMDDLLTPYEDLAVSLDDKSRLGIFLAWLGWAHWGRERYDKAIAYVGHALKIGEEIDDQTTIGYACTWLTWICVTLGRLDDAILFGERAQEISKLIPSDHYLYFKSMGGIGHTSWYRGDRNRALESGEAMVEFGRRRGNIRSMVWGYQFIGDAHLMNGDVTTALEWFERQAREAQDPLYYHAAQTGLGIAYVLNGQFQEAGPPLEKVMEFSLACRWEWIGMFAKIFLSAVWIAEGRMSQGLELMEKCRQTCWEKGRKFLYALSEYLLGNVYLQISLGEGELGLSTVIKNVGFLVKTVPFAASKAECHFNEAIKVADEIGAKWMLGLAYLDLGRLHKAKNRQHEARECLSKAVDCFDRCEAEIYLKQAQEAMDSLV